MEPGKVLFIGEKEAKQLLTMSRVVDLMEKVFIEYGNNRVVNPEKLHLSLRPHVDGYLNSMPSFLIESGLMGVKLVGCTKMNPSRGLPTTIGVIVLFTPETGVPYAIVDGTFITAIRTGAMAGLQAKYLARKNSSVLTLIGAGVQGYTSMQAIQTALGGLREVRLVDINPEMIKKFLEKGKQEFPETEFVVKDDIQTAAEDADIVASCANAGKPLLQGIEFAKGTLVISVSECIQSVEWIKNTFDMMVADFPECLVMRVNQENLWTAEQKGEKPVMLSVEMIDETLGEIIAGRKKGRISDDQIIFSATVGMSMEDVIAAQEVYLHALEKGIGKELDFMDLDDSRQEK